MRPLWERSLPTCVMVRGGRWCWMKLAADTVPCVRSTNVEGYCCTVRATSGSAAAHSPTDTAWNHTNGTWAGRRASVYLRRTYHPRAHEQEQEQGQTPVASYAPESLAPSSGMLLAVPSARPHVQRQRRGRKGGSQAVHCHAPPRHAAFTPSSRLSPPPWHGCQAHWGHLPRRAAVRW